jgi:integrase
MERYISMPTTTLTQLTVDRLRPTPGKTHDYHWDRLLPGFGLRVSSKNKKSYVVNARLGPKLLTHTIGSTLQITKVEEARQRAREFQMSAKAGNDPVAIRRAKIAQEKVEEAAAQAQAEADAFTVAVLFGEYISYSKARHKPGTAYENRRLLDRVLALSNFGDRPASSVTTAELRSYVNELRPGAQGEVERSNQLVALGRAFRWGVDVGKVELNPVTGIKVPAKAASRDRILTDDEIRRFWSASATLGWPFGDAVRMLLLTGQRLQEVSAMEWAEVDLDNRQWTISAARAKNGKANVVPLNDTAVQILTSSPRLAHCRFVFSTNGRSPIQGHSRAKRRLDAAMGDCPRWTLHDLRRTFSSGLQRLGVRFEVNESLLNHAGLSRSGVAAIYQRHAWTDEKRQAMDQWGEFLARLIA